SIVNRELPVAADSAPVEEFTLKVTRERIWLVAEQYRAHAALGRGHEDRAERAFADGEADHGAVAARAEVGRRHAEDLGRGRIEASARAKAGAIDRVGHALAARELVPHGARAVRGGIGSRREPGRRL